MCLILGAFIWAFDYGLNLLRLIMYKLNYSSLLKLTRRTQGLCTIMKHLKVENGMLYTYSGYENKIKANLEKIVENRNMRLHYRYCRSYGRAN